MNCKTGSYACETCPTRCAIAAQFVDDRALKLVTADGRLKCATAGCSQPRASYGCYCAECFNIHSHKYKRRKNETRSTRYHTDPEYRERIKASNRARYYANREARQAYDRERYARRKSHD